MVEITLCFFVYVLENPTRWPEILLRIQFILNNTLSSTTGKIPNKIAYGFLPRKPLGLISSSFLPDTYITRVDTANAISFALANQKPYYNRKHQPFFMKVGN